MMHGITGKGDRMDDDLIGRQELLNRTINNPLHPPYITERDVLNCPPAQPRDECEYWDSESFFCALHRPFAQPEQKKGTWRHYEGTLTCSVCGAAFDDDIMEHLGDDVPRFCPDCGADLRGEQDDT